jgi:hypothetical protein
LSDAVHETDKLGFLKLKLHCLARGDGTLAQAPRCISASIDT